MEPTLVPQIVRESPLSGLAQTLLARLDAELRERYPVSSIHIVDPRELTNPGATFVVAWLDGEAVGCGGLRGIGSEMGEIKRMFVEPAKRGRGIARAILGVLEETARAFGYQVLRLETGAEQPEAMRLYESAGYVVIPAFGEYIGDPLSLCYEKRLG